MYDLPSVIIENSFASTFGEAVNEWDVIKHEKNPNSKCICGKKGITHCFTIENHLEFNQLFPIGSCCVKQFGRKDLNERMKQLQSGKTLKNKYC